MTILKGVFLLVTSLFLWASCNTKSPSETTETLKVDNVVQTEEEYKSGKWLEELPAKTQLTFNELEELLPESLLGKPLVKVIDVSRDGMSAIKAEYSLDNEPNNESEVITFFIMDGAGNEGHKHLKSMFNSFNFPIDDEEGIDILKITDWENKRLLVRQRQVKEKWVSNLEFIKNLRFHLKIDAKNLNLEEIREGANVLEQLNFPY